MKLRPPLAAAIFDMDGLLIDSEPIHFESLMIQFRRYGVEYDQALHDTLVGTTDEHVYETVRRADPRLTAPTATLIAERHQLFLDLVDRPLSPLPGVVGLLQTFAREGLPCAVASSSPQEHIDRVLANLGIAEHFVTTRSGNSVARSKPAPDVYLASADDLRVDPRSALVFEDSGPGTKAGRAAGCVVVGVPCIASRGHDLSAAHERFESLEAVVLSELRTRWASYRT